MASHNGRFGASGAVTRSKVCADLEVLCPSERQWKPRLRQAAGTLAVSVESIVEKVSHPEKELHLESVGEKNRPEQLEY